jgi:uncharacterized membrane protein
MSQMMYVMAASYDDVDDAVAALRAIESAYHHVGSSHDFDAAVVQKNESGKVEIAERHNEGSRQGAKAGLSWGLAAGLAAALLPPVGIIGGLAVGGAAGAGIGALIGRTHSGMDKDELKSLTEVLERGDAGLVVFYAPEMAGQVSANVTTATSTVHATTGISAEELAAQIRAAQEEPARSGS